MSPVTSSVNWKYRSKAWKSTYLKILLFNTETFLTSEDRQNYTKAHSVLKKNFGVTQMDKLEFTDLSLSWFRSCYAQNFWQKLQISIPPPYKILLIATLGYILDSQLIWESGKFQLARWSQNVALFSTRNHPPPTHPQDIFFLTSTYLKKLRFGIQPNLTNFSCLGHLSRQHLSSSLNHVRCSPPCSTSKTS